MFMMFAVPLVYTPHTIRIARARQHILGSWSVNAKRAISNEGLKSFAVLHPARQCTSRTPNTPSTQHTSVHPGRPERQAPSTPVQIQDAQHAKHPAHQYTKHPAHQYAVQYRTPTTSTRCPAPPAMSSRFLYIQIKRRLFYSCRSTR